MAEKKQDANAKPKVEKKAKAKVEKEVKEVIKEVVDTPETEKTETKAEAIDTVGGFPAKVVETVGRTGVREEIVQVRCEVLEGRDSGKVLVRNVKSPVKLGDILLLAETAMQARKLEAKR